MEAVVIERGHPVQESVPGSLDYQLYRTRIAFYRTFPDTESETLWVLEIFSDHLIVESSRLPHGFYYRVEYEAGPNYTFAFAEREAWQTVQLAYQPTTLAERLREKVGERIVETFSESVQLLEATRPGSPRRIRGIGAIADTVNGNGRRYRTAVLREAVRDMQEHLRQSAGQGRGILLGEAEHPPQKGNRSAQFLETIVRWDMISLDESETPPQIELEGQMIETSLGKDAIVLMDAGVLPGLSLRGYGESKLIEEDGQEIEEVMWLRLTGFDLVLTPAFADAGILTIESKSEEKKMSEKTEQTTAPPVQGTPDVSNMTAAELRLAHPELFEQVLELAELEEEREARRQRELEEQRRQEAQEAMAQIDRELREAIGAGETDDLPTVMRERAQRLQELEAAEQRRRVQQYVESETAELKYPDFMIAQLREAIDEDAPATIEEAKKSIVRHRKTFDRLASEFRLRAKGLTGGVDVLGPVLESELGIPMWQAPAYEITEALIREQRTHRRDLTSPKANVNERWAARYLEMYDAKFKPQLLNEAKAWQEAEATSDLALPYSVMRSVIAAVFPELVAVSVFDTGVMSNSPDLLYFESYEAEDGAVDEVSDEEVEITTLGTWYALANRRVRPGTVVVTDETGTTTHALGVDYVIDHGNGRIQGLMGGGITAADTVKVSYTYDAMRKGEDAVIERGKGALASVTITAAADRLSSQLTDEAIKFSRSQLGYDAPVRAIGLLISEIRRRIDANLFSDALSAAMLVPNNSGGTWTSSTDDIEKFVQYIGVAKTKIENRWYEPHAIVLSATRADEISNWDGFTAAGSAPGNELTPAGQVGRLKGLPVFRVTTFPDEFALVLNRELLMHRVYSPMELRGPFPVYDQETMQLKANSEWYVQEYNAYATPVPDKGSFVVIA